jgi:hypothetical protein
VWTAHYAILPIGSTSGKPVKSGVSIISSLSATVLALLSLLGVLLGCWMGVRLQRNLWACPVLLWKASGTMRGFVQQWSALIAAVLVVLSIVSTRSTLRTQVGGVQDRLTALEKHMESIRNALEGQQGIGVRMATLDIRGNEQLQRLMAQRETSLERHEQDTFTTQDALQALQTTLDTIATMTQRIAFVEEMLLEIQGGLAELRQPRTNVNR